MAQGYWLAGWLWDPGPPRGSLLEAGHDRSGLPRPILGTLIPLRYLHECYQCPVPPCMLPISISLLHTAGLTKAAELWSVTAEEGPELRE